MRDNIHSDKLYDNFNLAVLQFMINLKFITIQTPLILIILNWLKILLQLKINVIS